MGQERFGSSPLKGVRFQVVQPISKTTIPQNCLFDEFRRTYDVAYDLQFEGLQHLPPQSAAGTL